MGDTTHCRLDACPLLLGRPPDLGDEPCEVSIGLLEKLLPAKLGLDCALKKLGNLEVPCPDQLVQGVGKVDPHARHGPAYTPEYAAAPLEERQPSR